MTLFSGEAPRSESRWPVVRIQPGATIAVQLLGRNFVRVATHFFRSTFICLETDECDACELLPARPYWYLPCIALATGQCSLLELSSHASADLEQKLKFAGGAVEPGVQVELSRRSKKAPVRVEILELSASTKVAPLYIWVTALMRIYKLPPITAGESLEQYGARVSPKVRERAKLVAAAMRATSAGRARSRVTES